MRTSTIWRSLMAAAALLICAPAAEAACGGDCNDNGSVAINELVLGVNSALGTAQFSQCTAFDTDDSDSISIAELVAAVNNALRGCPATPTATLALETPTSTATAPPANTATATAADPTATATTAEPTSTATIGEPTATVTAATSTATVTAEVTNTAGSTPTSTSEITPVASATATLSSMPTATVTDTPAVSATSTTTPTVSATPTPTATTASSAECGNGLLEPGETCESCADDCIVSPCTPTVSMPSFAVHFSGVVGTVPTTVTVLLGYQSDLVSIPGMSNEMTVRQRITYPPPVPFPQSPNDLNYGLRMVVGRTAGIPNGLLATVKFDACQGASTAVPGDFACTVEGCAGAGGPINGCDCSVTLP